jgi:hypothetical protein
MIEAARLKPFLLHQDRDVRDSVAAYFADSWARDENLIPVILDAVDRYGPEETTHMLVAAPCLPMNQESLPRLMASLAAARGFDTILRLNEILRRAAVPLLQANESAIREAQNVRPETLERFQRRRELATKPGEELWRMLRALSDKSRDAHYAGDIDHSYAGDLIEAVGRCDVPDAAEVCSLLSAPEVDGEWLEVFLVDLAGVRRMREAVPQLVAKLHIDTDYLLERVCEALARIGEPEAARLVRAEFGGSTWDFRIYASGMLGDLKHEESERAVLALLGSEEDATIRTNLCYDLCKLFSLEGIDVVRREIAPGYDRWAVCLEQELLVVTEVLGVDLPEKVQWRAQRAEALLRQAERRAELAGLGSRHAELKARGIDPFAGIGEEANLEDEEPVQPIRRQAEKVGRNAPCPCGSGRKYKKCCGREQPIRAVTPTKNASAAIAVAAQDSSERSRMTIQNLERVEYRRGLVEAGMTPEDLPLKRWNGAAIPLEIRQAIEKEDLLRLGGVYGDRRAGDPMEYDGLRLIGPDDAVEITFYNRAITLFMTDDEVIRRIHRILCKLSDAPAGETARAG